jgi:hypothetical protein
MLLYQRLQTRVSELIRLIQYSKVKLPVQRAWLYAASHL